MAEAKCENEIVIVGTDGKEFKLIDPTKLASFPRMQLSLPLAHWYARTFETIIRTKLAEKRGVEFVTVPDEDVDEYLTRVPFMHDDVIYRFDTAFLDKVRKQTDGYRLLTTEHGHMNKEHPDYKRWNAIENIYAANLHGQQFHPLTSLI